MFASDLLMGMVDIYWGAGDTVQLHDSDGATHLPDEHPQKAASCEWHDQVEPATLEAPSSDTCVVCRCSLFVKTMEFAAGSPVSMTPAFLGRSVHHPQVMSTLLGNLDCYLVGVGTAS
jgi:hypothetical protein